MMCISLLQWNEQRTMEELHIDGCWWNNSPENKNNSFSEQEFALSFDGTGIIKLWFDDDVYIVV